MASFLSRFIARSMMSGGHGDHIPHSNRWVASLARMTFSPSMIIYWAFTMPASSFSDVSHKEKVDDPFKASL